MPGAQVVVDVRVFRLPARVDREVLTRVWHDLEASAGTMATQCVLDFALTEHIRFQDLQQFVRIVRERWQPSRPVLLSNLNSYCGEICRFALSAGDWDHFRRVERVMAAERAWGNAGSGVRTVFRERAAQRVAGGRFLPPPSLN
jgi:hypothetical protein